MTACARSRKPSAGRHRRSVASSGQADAGLVYVTDVKGAAGKVDGVTFKDASSAINTYPTAVLKESKNPDLAAAFIHYVRSNAGQKVLQAAGFQAC